MTQQFHLAQVNIARMLAPLDDPIMAGFVSRLDELNALAEGAPGYVWRLKTEEGNATSIRVFDDDMLIVNMSVWENIDVLFTYAYQSQHVEAFRQRRDWFSKMDSHILALWWIPAGHIPTTEEAKQKFDYLNTHGPTPLAFTFKQRFAVPEMLEYTA